MSTNSRLISFPRVRVGESRFSLQTITSEEADRRFRGFPPESCFDTESTRSLGRFMAQMANLHFPGHSQLRTNFRSRPNWWGIGYPIPYTDGIFLCEDARLRAAHPNGIVGTLALGAILSLKTLGAPSRITERLPSGEMAIRNRATGQHALEEFAIRAAAQPQNMTPLAELLPFLTGYKN